MFVGMCRSVHMCLVWLCPLYLQKSMVLILLRAVTSFSQKIVFVPGLFSAAVNEEGRFIININ